MTATARSALAVVLAGTIASVTVATCYVAFGWLAAFIFTFGFLGGFVAWLILQARPPFAYFRWPY